MSIGSRALLGLLLFGAQSCGEPESARVASSDSVTAAVERAPKTQPSERTLPSAAREVAAAALPKDALSRSMKGLKTVRRPDGVMKLHLGGRFYHASVATIAEDGQLRAACVDGAPPATFVAGSPPPDIELQNSP